MAQQLANMGVSWRGQWRLSIKSTGGKCSNPKTPGTSGRRGLPHPVPSGFLRLGFLHPKKILWEIGEGSGFLGKHNFGTNIWVFPQMAVPPKHHKMISFTVVGKFMVVGYHRFRKPPNGTDGRSFFDFPWVFRNALPVQYPDRWRSERWKLYSNTTGLYILNQHQ